MDDKRSLGLGFADFVEANSRTDYQRDHKLRYIETFSRLLPWIKRDLRVLELGELSAISVFLGEQLNCEVEGYTEDLRYPIDLRSGNFDLILMLEVIEHIKDRPSSNQSIGEISTFTLSGVTSLLAECGRLVKKDGILMISTPEHNQSRRDWSYSHGETSFPIPAPRKRVRVSGSSTVG